MVEPPNTQQFLDAIDSHVAVVNRDGIIVQVNRSWQTYGERNGLRTPMHGIGSSYLEVCASAAASPGADAETARHVLRGIEQILDGTHDSFTREYPCHSPTGPRWFRLHAAAVPGPGGEVVLTHHDITEYRLQAHVARAERMRALRRAIGGVAHRYNNLMQVAFGFGSVLLEEHRAGDPERIAELEVLRRSAEQANRFGTDLVAFCGRSSASRRPLDLNQVVARVHGRFRAAIPSNVHFSLRLAAEPSRVIADERQMIRVLEELIHSALETASCARTITLAVSDVTVGWAAWEDYPFLPTGRYAGVSVTDSAATFAADILDHIGEPFQQTHDAMKAGGLGLAVAVGLVEQNGGALAFRNQPGGGCRSTVLLPRAEGTG